MPLPKDNIGEVVEINDHRGGLRVRGILTEVEWRDVRDMFGNGNYIRVQYARVISKDGHIWYEAQEIKRV